MDFFTFDSTENTLQIDDHHILLVKEFANLWDVGRNKCEADKTGKKRLRAFREFTFLFLMLDFKSPYFKYTEGDKYEAAIDDSGLTKEELEDPLFIKAYEKYTEMQECDPILSLIKTAQRTLYKSKIFLDNIDFNEDVDETGRPLYKPKDVLADIAGIAKMRLHLQDLEEQYKTSLAESSGVRGGVELGYDEV